MSKIDDNFCGYLNIGDDTFVYNISNNVVTLLPAQIEQVKRYEVLDRIQSRDIDSPEYLFGIDDNNYKIAMLRNGKFNNGFFGISPSIKFATPIIIKAAGNLDGFYSKLTEDWDKFHSITFYGGNIISKWSLPQVDEASVGSFVKLRNSKTHSGIIEWGNNAELYTALFALVYACLFRYIGLSNEVIKSAILRIF